MKYDNDFTKELKSINDKLDKRKINRNSRNTPTKISDESAVSRYYKANNIEEPEDRLTEEVQVKNIEIMNYIKGIAKLFEVTEFIASKISHKELNSLVELDVYQYKKSIINGIFNNFSKSEVDTSVKILSELNEPISMDLQYIQHLYTKYPKNNKSQHKLALKELIAEHFPNMSLSNIEAIVSV